MIGSKKKMETGLIRSASAALIADASRNSGYTATDRTDKLFLGNRNDMSDANEC